MLETPFPFFICKKPGEIPIFGTFLAKKLIFCQFWSMFTENPIFESGHVWKRHCDVIRWPIFMILVSMERGDPTLYHGTKQSHFGPVNFKFIGVVTTPLGKPCFKKRLGRTRVNGWDHKTPITWLLLGSMLQRVYCPQNGWYIKYKLCHCWKFAKIPIH